VCADRGRHEILTEEIENGFLKGLMTIQKQQLKHTTCLWTIATMWLLTKEMQQREG